MVLSIQMLKLLLLDQFYLLQCQMAGVYNSSMCRMCFFMASLKKMCSCGNHLTMRWKIIHIMCCKLDKALYGLKQASCAWYSHCYRYGNCKRLITAGLNQTGGDRLSLPVLNEPGGDRFLVITTGLYHDPTVMYTYHRRIVIRTGQWCLIFVLLPFFVPSPPSSSSTHSHPPLVSSLHSPSSLLKFPSISWIRSQIGLTNVNINFRLIIFNYPKHMQLKFDLSARIPFTEIKWLDIA